MRVVTEQGPIEPDRLRALGSYALVVDQPPFDRAMTGSMVFDRWSDVGRCWCWAPLAYVVMVVVLRMSGKRTLAKLNAFDLVVTVALGSVLATIALSSDVSFVDGCRGGRAAGRRSVGGVVRIGAHVVDASPGPRRGRRSCSTDGRFDDAAMSQSRLTRGEVLSGDPRERLRRSRIGCCGRCWRPTAA